MIKDDLLDEVIGPARYLGCEHNIVEKDPQTVTLRFALCYPDVYEVGTSHVGSHILYHVLNSRPDTYCERAYHPWSDATELLRRGNIPLASLETDTPLRDFHILGITLQHELNYASALSLLDLGGITLRAADRAPTEPIVIAGGPCAVNPEPMAPFFEALVIGEGEEVLHEIMDLLAGFSPPFADPEIRSRFLGELSRIEGVYVPSLWPVEQVGRFIVPQPPSPDKPVVRRRIVENLDAAPFPARPLVPYRESVHDRAQIEISRGCTRGCRFCQAGIIYRPTRERSVETLRRLANEIIAATGYDQISLSSLSCTDYTRIEELLELLHQDLSDRRVSIGLPSIRVDAFGVELARRVQRVKKSGLTFAPEAGSQSLRDRINKNVTEANLTEAAAAALQAGWHKIKLYFMIGLPGETDEDVLAIAQTVQQMLDLGRECLGKRSGRLRLNVSVALFIPKPHTPFQWAAQDSLDQFDHKRRLLRERLDRHKQVKLSCHDAPAAIVEAFLSRGDRTAADVIESAFRSGAMLDAWTEHFDYHRWCQAATEHDIDIQTAASTPIPVDAALPWDHIDVGVTKEYLLSELEKSQAGTTTDDCRDAQCYDCGIQRLVASCYSDGDAHEPA